MIKRSLIGRAREHCLYRGFVEHFAADDDRRAFRVLEMLSSGLPSSSTKVGELALRDRAHLKSAPLYVRVCKAALWFDKKASHELGIGEGDRKSVV